MIGNGGDESFGDHWGNIDINGGGDLIMEARGGWDGVSIFSTNTTGMPRLGQYEDNSTTGSRNFAYIGNGGYNASHRVVANNPAHISGSGKIGEGMGVWGPSDINILTGGDIRLMAAQEATVGPKLYQQAFRQTVGSAIVYTDYFGNVVDLLDYSEHAPRLTVIDRSDGNTWVLPRSGDDRPGQFRSNRQRRPRLELSGRSRRRRASRRHHHPRRRRNHRRCRRLRSRGSPMARPSRSMPSRRVAIPTPTTSPSRWDRALRTPISPGSGRPGTTSAPVPPSPATTPRSASEVTRFGVTISATSRSRRARTPETSACGCTRARVPTTTPRSAMAATTRPVTTTMANSTT
jgi:hypothetical protein